MLVTARAFPDEPDAPARHPTPAEMKSLLRYYASDEVLGLKPIGREGWLVASWLT